MNKVGFVLLDNLGRGHALWLSPDEIHLCMDCTQSSIVFSIPPPRPALLQRFRSRFNSLHWSCKRIVSAIFSGNRPSRGNFRDRCLIQSSQYRLSWDLSQKSGCCL